MLMSDFLLTRKSVRTFKNKKLDKRSIEEVERIITDINTTDEHTEYKLFLNGEEIAERLEGKAGYAGVMIKAPAYIAMQTLVEEPIAYIEGAFSLEKLITQLKALGLGSCWVTLLEVDESELKSIFGYTVGYVRYILAVGYPPRDLNIGKATYSSRIGVEDYVCKGDLNTKMTIGELESMGMDDLFYYLRMAPSSYNKQPWRFVIDDNSVKLYIADPKGLNDFVDIGIVIYYYNELAKTIGLHPKWDINVKEINDEYYYVGETTI